MNAGTAAPSTARNWTARSIQPPYTAAATPITTLSTTVSAGGAVLLVTHDNTVAARADREVRLRGGVIEHEVALS